MTNTKGMTLVEVVIAVSILAFLSIFTAQAIQSAITSRNKIQGEMDRSVQLREALNVMSRDIQLAFNYRDINIRTFNAAQEERQKRARGGGGDGDTDGEDTGDTGNTDNTGNPNPNLNFQKKQEIIVTQFIGSQDELSFTSLSQVRTRKNSAISEQAKVGYSVKGCRARLDSSRSTTCLWRRISPYLDDDVTQGGQESVLLEDVNDFSLRYLGPGHEEEWVNVWRSDGQGEAIMEGRFPYAVEISLSIADNRTDPPRSLGMTVVSPVRFPNNPPEDKGGIVESP